MPDPNGLPELFDWLWPSLPAPKGVFFFLTGISSPELF
jgi:hypothetical protein